MSTERDELVAAFAKLSTEDRVKLLASLHGDIAAALGVDSEAVRRKFIALAFHEGTDGKRAPDILGDPPLEAMRRQPELRAREILSALVDSDEATAALAKRLGLTIIAVRKAAIEAGQSI
jgi:predicted ArsR family transcriptional regulator